jgi:flagellar biosynthesis/type III secretory pathway protein FliH
VVTVYQFSPQQEVRHEIEQSKLDLRAGEDGIIVTLTDLEPQAFIDGQIVLTTHQAGELAKALIALLGSEDEEDYGVGYDMGYAAGYRDGEEEGARVGYEQGFHDGDGEGFDRGYELGNERGWDAAMEDCA